MSTESAGRRFAIGLSFPGEVREFAKRLDQALSARFSPQQVFFDERYKAELLGVGLHIKLGKIYRENCDLLVPLFCQYYEKPWCEVEWSAISTIMLTARREDRVIPIRLDRTPIDGWEATDMAILASDYTVEKIADLLFKVYQQRIGQSETEGVTDSTPAPSPEKTGLQNLKLQLATILEHEGLRKQIAASNDLDLRLTATQLAEQIFAVTPDWRVLPQKRTPMCFLFQATETIRKMKTPVMDAEWLDRIQLAAGLLLPVSAVDHHSDANRRKSLKGTVLRFNGDDARLGAAIVGRTMGLKLWLNSDHDVTVEDAVFPNDSRQGLPVDSIRSLNTLNSLAAYLAGIPQLRARSDRFDDLSAALDLWEARNSCLCVWLMNQIPEKELSAIHQQFPQLVLIQADEDSNNSNNRVNAYVLQQWTEIERFIARHRVPRT